MTSEEHAAQDAYAFALRKIESYRNYGETVLNLSGLGLRSLPPEIGQIPWLQFLYLEKNQLCELPPEIGRLSGLIELDVSDNQLIGLPPEIVHLHKLFWLDLRNNRLCILPIELTQLTSLDMILLDGNPGLRLQPEGSKANLAPGENRSRLHKSAAEILAAYFHDLESRS